MRYAQEDKYEDANCRIIFEKEHSRNNYPSGWKWKSKMWISKLKKN